MPNVTSTLGRKFIANPTDPDELWTAILENCERVAGGCLIWHGFVNHNGYGVLRSNGKRWLLHRLVWTLHNGDIPAETPVVCHRCDNPPCVAPEHLFLGTQTDNMADMNLKGRHGANQNAGKTHCKRGHEFTAENTLIDCRGDRGCRACGRLRDIERKIRARQHADPPVHRQEIQ